MMLNSKIIDQIHHDNDRTLKKKYLKKIDNNKLWDLSSTYLYIQQDYKLTKKPVDIIECGCGWGMVAYAELTRQPDEYNYLHIKSWTGYECDSNNIKIATKIFDECKKKGYSGPIPKWIHTAITNSRKKFVNINIPKNKQSDAIEVSSLFAKKLIPNTHYNKLPKCDIVLIDIEGQEVNLDYKKIDAHLYQVESHDKQYTTKLIQELKDSNIFKILDVRRCNIGGTQTLGGCHSIITFTRTSRDLPRSGFQSINPRAE
jgi:hypothetical protein